MSITMRIIQEYDVRNEKEFMDLERQFAQLESRRPDYPKGKRMKGFSGSIPANCLIWECEFEDMNAAHQALNLFEGDAEHDELFVQQSPYFKQVHIEFYENLEF